MDPQRFDAFARALSAATSRRGALAGLLVGLIAPLAGHTGAEARRHRRRRHVNGRQSDTAQGRDSGDRISAEKKKHKHKKKKSPNPGCTPSCTGKTCGAADGCGGVCHSGSCNSGASCVNGQCVPDSGGCTPACTGGRVCQSNGTCACPPDKPHSGGLCGDDTCRECCTSDDCPDRFFMQCRHDLGSICVCGSGTVECNNICQTCCEDQDCAPVRDPGDGFFCNLNHGCECRDGQSECGKADQSGYFCADLQHDPANCGFCGFDCGGHGCIAGNCTA